MILHLTITHLIAEGSNFSIRDFVNTDLETMLDKYYNYAIYFSVWIMSEALQYLLSEQTTLESFK